MTRGKKGLSIGAAMKQRMGAQETEETAPQEKEALPPDHGSPRGTETALPTMPPPVEGKEAFETFTARVPRGLQRRIKVYAVTQGLKVQDVVARALEEYLARQEGGGG